MQTIGDLSRHFTMQRQTAQLKTDMTRLTNELSSGRVADPAARVGGDLQQIGHLEATLTRNAAYDRSGRETATRLAHASETFSLIGDLTGDLGRELLQTSTTDLSGRYDAFPQDAKRDFAGVVSAINASHAGRSAFSGTATTGTALLDAEAMLAALATDVAGATSAADLQQAVEDWFAPGGGFDTVGYLGAAQDLAPVKLGDHGEIAQGWRGDDLAVRSALSALALAAVTDDHPATTDPAARQAVLVAAGEALLDAEHASVAAEAEVGREQARLDTVMTRISAETASLEMAKTDLLAADPYRTATALEQVQQQLEMSYILTSRMSDLTLTRYLR
ncbi:flagellin [Aestuariibius sp. 2305UL40-4]|uniref:flagellin n=1 Tax=Aestuariibius violaceus TaxID=3234132 RepID=UPI00345E8C31